MTAINIFLQKTRAIVMTDALFIDFRTGEAVMLLDKCFEAPGTNMAVAARGDYRVPSGIAGDLRLLYANIDQLIADRGDAIRDLYDAWLASADEIVYAPVQIGIVGWSDELDRPRGAFVALADSWSFAEIDPADGLAGPLPDDVELSRLAMLGVKPRENWDFDSFDPERHGIPFMEAQRRLRLALPNGARDNLCIVGGHILLTEVTRSGVSQRVIHTWPDQIGVPIRPEPFVVPTAVAPTMPPNMNRQQRRAWERQHGKAAA